MWLMPTLARPRFIASAVTTCSFLVLAASPALAGVKIPERQYVPAGMTSVVDLRVDAGCDGAPTDGLEVSIPESLPGAVPEALPGWTIETGTVPMEAEDGSGPSEQVSTIRWSGGSLPDGQFLDFAFRAPFPDEVGAVLTFPVIQTCGTVQIDWTDAEEGDHPAPVVRVDESVTQREITDTVAAVDVLSVEVQRIQEQIGAVNVTGLRDRVEDLEAAVEQLTQAFVELEDQLAAAGIIVPEPTP